MRLKLSEAYQKMVSKALLPPALIYQVICTFRGNPSCSSRKEGGGATHTTLAKRGTKGRSKHYSIDCRTRQAW